MSESINALSPLKFRALLWPFQRRPKLSSLLVAGRKLDDIEPETTGKQGQEMSRLFLVNETEQKSYLVLTLRRMQLSGPLLLCLDEARFVHFPFRNAARGWTASRCGSQTIHSEVISSGLWLASLSSDRLGIQTALPLSKTVYQFVIRRSLYSAHVRSHKTKPFSSPSG